MTGHLILTRVYEFVLYMLFILLFIVVALGMLMGI